MKQVITTQQTAHADKLKMYDKKLNIQYKYSIK